MFWNKLTDIGKYIEKTIKNLQPEAEWRCEADAMKEPYKWRE
jgi:hypothetical protein